MHCVRDANTHNRFAHEIEQNKLNTQDERSWATFSSHGNHTLVALQFLRQPSPSPDEIAPLGGELPSKVVCDLSRLVSSQPEGDSLKRLQQGEELQWQVGVSSREGHSGEPGGLVHCHGIKCVGGGDNLRRGGDCCVRVCVCVCVSKATLL